MLTTINSITTPCIVIDRAKFIENCSRMQQVADEQKLAFRPHVKTLKSLAAASVYAPNNTPITVSTLAEAKYFALAGYDDILYAVGITPNKFGTIEEIQKLAKQFTVTADSIDAVNALVLFSLTASEPIRVVLEVDSDNHRAGLQPDSPELLKCATALSTADNIYFRGLMTHAGASYDCFSDTDRERIAHTECEQIALAAKHIVHSGIACELISAGSTPTALAGIQHAGITELRAGVYATFDCVMANLGVCAFTDIAMSVLTCVIGHQKNRNWVLIDAGWMALSRDQGTSDHEQDCGYGLVCDANGTLLEGWYVKSTNQEHGIICHKENKAIDENTFGYGTLLRILPIHACATAAQHLYYHLIDDTGTVLEQWDSVRGW